jgi:2-polyprenyl-3-methyl-5-hydroxy-6-metoxy-1,4-benzoquinol methylase
MSRNAMEFDKIAQEIFFPIYPVIADDILKLTGIRSGRLLDVGSGGGHLGLWVFKGGRRA